MQAEDWEALTSLCILMASTGCTCTTQQHGKKRGEDVPRALLGSILRSGSPPAAQSAPELSPAQDPRVVPTGEPRRCASREHNFELSGAGCPSDLVPIPSSLGTAVRWGERLAAPAPGRAQSYPPGPGLAQVPCLALPCLDAAPPRKRVHFKSGPAPAEHDTPIIIHTRRPEQRRLPGTASSVQT